MVTWDGNTQIKCEQMNKFTYTSLTFCLTVNATVSIRIAFAFKGVDKISACPIVLTRIACTLVNIFNKKNHCPA